MYFLYSSEDIYQETLLQNILILLVLKLFSVLANGILTKCSDSKIISSIANFLKYNTRLWVLLIAIIESNTIKLAFNSFIQLLSNGVLKKQDKLNLVVTFAFLFILLLNLFQLFDAVSQNYQFCCLLVSEEHGSFTTVEL